MNDLKSYWAVVREKMIPAIDPAVIASLEGAFYAGVVATLKLQSEGVTKAALITEALKMVDSWPEATNE